MLYVTTSSLYSCYACCLPALASCASPVTTTPICLPALRCDTILLPITLPLPCLFLPFTILHILLFHGLCTTVATFFPAFTPACHLPLPILPALPPICLPSLCLTSPACAMPTCKHCHHAPLPSETWITYLPSCLPVPACLTPCLCAFYHLHLTNTACHTCLPCLPPACPSTLTAGEYQKK